MRNTDELNYTDRYPKLGILGNVATHSTYSQVLAAFRSTSLSIASKPFSVLMNASQLTATPTRAFGNLNPSSNEKIDTQWLP